MAIIVVIPYRDRAPQLARLVPRLHQLNVDRIVICEQGAGTAFNRGWIKNCGFWLARAGPADTVYFHDVDLLPGAIFPLLPTVAPGTVRHLYGHVHCFGGIVGLRAADFIQVNGFTNSLSVWGGEDKLLLDSCQKLHTDRRQFGLRFGNSRYIGEMNDSGDVMDPGVAHAAFTAMLRHRQKIVPSLVHHRPDLASTQWRLQVQRPTLYNNVVHYVVVPV